MREVGRGLDLAELIVIVRYVSASREIQTRLGSDPVLGSGPDMSMRTSVRSSTDHLNHLDHIQIDHLDPNVPF